MNLRRWTLYVAPKFPKGAEKTQTPFWWKIVLSWKKVCYKVSLCENCQRQSCTAFTGQSNGAKMMGRWRSLLPEILAETVPPPFRNTEFQSIFSRSASAVTLRWKQWVGDAYSKYSWSDELPPADGWRKWRLTLGFFLVFPILISISLFFE